MRLNFLALIIMLLCPFVNSQEAIKADSGARQNTTFREISFDEFMKQVLETGRPMDFTPGYAKVVGVPVGSKARVFEVGSKLSVDKLGHSSQAILVPALTSQDHKPAHLLFGAVKAMKNQHQAHEFRASLAGVLEKAYISHMRLDEKGKIIRGAGTTEPLDINSSEVKRLFQRELDFWLKGKGRKPPAEARAEPGKSGTTPAPKADKAPAAGEAALTGKP